MRHPRHPARPRAGEGAGSATLGEAATSHASSSRRPPWAGLVGIALLVGAGVALATGALPIDDARRVAERTWPILLFVVAITIVAELAAIAGVFHAVVERLGRLGAGRTLVVWLLVLGLALACTILLSLDTTAVVLTPVVVLLARHLRLDPVPFAFTTVWIANAGSLLLPVSNLTNLLAQRELGLSPLAFAALLAPAAIACAAVPSVAILLGFRRSLVGTHAVAAGEPVADRALLVGGSAIVGLLVPALVSGVEVWIPASIAAAALLALVAVRRRGALSWRMVPWQVVALASGLFLVVETVHARGLTALLAPVVGEGDGLGALLRVAGTGMVLANGVDNLPAYLALEPLASDPVRMAALLVGVGAGALVTPWASLAILLWHDRLAALGVRVPWGRYVALSAIVAPAAVASGVLALWIAGLGGG